MIGDGVTVVKVCAISTLLTSGSISTSRPTYHKLAMATKPVPCGTGCGSESGTVDEAGHGRKLYSSAITRPKPTARPNKARLMDNIRRSFCHSGSDQTQMRALATTLSNTFHRPALTCCILTAEDSEALVCLY